MTAQQFRVAENIRLSHIQTDKFKTGVLTMTLTLPLNKKNSAFSQILPSVLRRGTQKFSDMAALNRRLDELYAAYVEIRPQRIGRNLALIFTAEFLDSRYIPDDTDVSAGVLDVLSQLLLYPKTVENGFDPAVTEQEIRFACDAVRAEINQPRSYALIRLAEQMYRNDEDYPTLQQTEKDLAKIDGHSLYQFYQTLLCTSPLEFFYVGSLSAGEVSAKILSFFGGWQGAPTHRLTPPLAEPSYGYLSHTEKMPVSQGKLAMGFRTHVCLTDNERYALLLFNELFGGSPASKLFLQVREAMNLCYYCSSAYHSLSGILTVSAGIENKNRATTEAAVLAQLEELRQGNISKTEWHAAQIALENAYRQMYDNPFDLQNFYGTRLLFGMDESIEEARKKIQKVSKEQVVALARLVECDTVFFIEGTQDEPDEEGEDDEN